jgi:S-adenosylmethionine uptake transporter
MRRDNTLLGILCVVTGMATGSLMDATIKSLSGGYPLHEIVMARSVVAIFLTIFIVHLEGGLSLLKTKRPFVHLTRGLLIVVANMTFYMAISFMPLAEATALFFVSPLIITALSVPFLGEKVGWRRWIGIIAGFFGVIIMIRPGVNTISIYSFLPIIAATAYASTQIITRRLGTTEKASVMSFYISLTFIVIAGCFWWFIGDGSLSGQYDPKVEFLFRAWKMPDSDDAMKMVFVGVLVAIVGYMLSQAYRVANASIVAPFEYVTLPLALLWGYLFWGEIPDLQAAIGMALIVGSGLYIFLREKRTTGIIDETYGIDSEGENLRQDE